MKIKTRVTGPNGERLVMSVAALTTGDLRVDPPGGRPKDRNAEQLDAAVDDTVAGLIGPENVEGHGRSSFGQNVDDVLDSALARYEADPALIQADRFYEGFHDATSVVADAVARIPAGTGPAVTMEGVVAATAVMSPAVEAKMNLRYAAELAVSIRRNPRISSMGSTDDEVAADEASARATGTNRMVAHLEGRLSQLLASKPKTLKRSDVQQEIKELQFSIDGIRAGSVQRLSDLPSIAAAHLLHASRKLRGPSVGDPPDGVRPDLWGAPGEPGAGFGVGKSWNGVESAVSLLRGYNVDIPALESAPAGGPRRWSNQYGEGIVGQRSPVTPDTGINDVKLRSFYNNIMDPTGRYSGADVTVDFHAENTAMMTLGSNSSGKGLPVGADGTRQGKSISGINSSPSVYTVPVGVRAHVADIMRDPARKARIAAVTGEDPATMPASRVQEIVWAEWKRVLAENPIPPPSQPAPGKTNKVKIRLANGKTRELVDYRNPKEDDVDEEAADE